MASAKATELGWRWHRRFLTRRRIDADSDSHRQAYYLEWHMRRCLAPMLFDDTDKEEAEGLRSSVVAQAQRSKAAVKKQTTGVTPDGLPVHSFRTLLADLATLA